MSVTVELGAFTGLTLDDPVLGRLDENPLDGAIAFRDVSEALVGVSTGRGRSRDLERTNAGQLSVSFNNEDRRFDPLNPDSDLSLYTVPRKPVRAASFVNSEGSGGVVADSIVDGFLVRSHTFNTLGSFSFVPSGTISDVSVSTDRVNLIPNPSFEADTTGWTGANVTATRITTESFVGSACAQVSVAAGVLGRYQTIFSSAGVRIPVTAGLPYMFSAYVKVPTGQPACSLRIRTTEWRADGTRNPDQVSITTVVTDSDGWVRLSFADTPVDGATPTVTMTFAVEETSADAVTFLVDGALVEQTSELRPYFDGGVYDDGTVTATTAWSGTENNSTSTATAVDVIPEVSATLPVMVDSGGLVVLSYDFKAFMFTGLIDDWNFTYSLGGRSVASIQASDAFSLFAREIAEGSAVQELSGARIERVLDEAIIPWPTLERDIEDGNATLAAGEFDGNALTYLQQVEESESGLIFMTKDGKFGFRERLFSPVSGAVTFTDAGNGIPYDDIEIVYGAELLVNDAIVTSTEGTATASDATSQVTYGVTTKTVSSLLASGSLQPLANYIVSRYKEPEYRIERIRVNMRALDTAQRADVLSLELGDQADVIFTPNRIGSAISIRNRVIGISHDVDPENHFVSLSFEALPFDFFILNNDPLGILDGDGVLGF